MKIALVAFEDIKSILLLASTMPYTFFVANEKLIVRKKKKRQKKSEREGEQSIDVNSNGDGRGRMDNDFLLERLFFGLFRILL
mmetsp:Transcript_35269/g.65354  ORF Transcript_35269/g.65354 Transcript_35269/m.65354 type:complete len:83 (-) Transcript_35269:103-351(-)